MDFLGKNIIITGGSTGIGAATAKLFAKNGANVFVLDIHPLGYSDKNITLINCDVSDFNQVKTAIQKIQASATTVDYLFSNAGLHAISTLEESSLELIDSMINVNIKGVIYTLKLVLPIMKAQQFGCIVLMGSDQCFIGKPSSAIYGLTKGAIGQLAKSTAIDYAPYNIKVNCVCPGTVDTPIADRAVKFLSNKMSLPEGEIKKLFCDAQPIKRLCQPEEVAKLVGFLCSDAAPYMTGSLVPIDGGITAQ